jgi:hypothetical protein
MNEDLIVWGMCAGVILLITILSYVTHLAFKPKEKDKGTATMATMKWLRELKKRTTFPGIFRSLTSSRASRVAIEEDVQN